MYQIIDIPYTYAHISFSAQRNHAQTAMQQYGNTTFPYASNAQVCQIVNSSKQNVSLHIALVKAT